MSIRVAVCKEIMLTMVFAEISRAGWLHKARPTSASKTYGFSGGLARRDTIYPSTDLLKFLRDLSYRFIRRSCWCLLIRML